MKSISAAEIIGKSNRIYPVRFIVKRSHFFRLIVFLPVFFLFLSDRTIGQSANFEITNKPWSDPELNNWGRGAVYWNGTAWDNSQAPEIPVGSRTGKNSFWRFNWSDLEDHNGNYTFYGSWPRLDHYVRQTIDRGEMLHFGGVMPICTSCGTETAIEVDGARMYYPKYVNDSMQKTSTPAWKTGSVWVPNWNNPYYLERYQALLYAVADYFKNGSYVAQAGPWAGKRIYYKDLLDAVGINGYGDFGEWHNWPYENQTPANAVATSASLKQIINASINAFPGTQIIAHMGGFISGGSSLVPLDVTYHLLTAKNDFGYLGWRRDNIGDRGYGNWLENNPNSYNGMRFDTAIINRWKYAMITGEPLNGDGSCCPYYEDIRRQTELYHYSAYGNGNYGSRSQAVWDTMRSVFKLSGYRYNLNGGAMSAALSTGNPFIVSLNWRNVGVAPIYQKRWKIKYELKNSSDQVVQAWYSRFKLYLFLPSSVDSVITENFDLNSTVTPGTSYKLTVKLEDTLGVLEPIYLAINTPSRNTDGSYTLRSDITVLDGAAPNNPPTADAGSDQYFSLPASSTELVGKGTDPENGRLDYQWSSISGPSVPIIRTPGQSRTMIDGFKAGQYGFQLKVSDSIGDFALDTVFIFVNDPPRVNAGADQSITLPDNIIQLSATATDTDGNITSIAWEKVSGPAEGTIQSPGSLSTRVEGLTQGDYFFLITVKDDRDASAQDTVFIKVNKKPNMPPVANAGIDIDLILPDNSTQLNAATSTDPDGSITQFTWKVISGPSSYAFGNISASSSSFYDLIQGKYVVLLTVKDNEGLQDTDTMVVNVYPDPNNIAPTANAGTDIQLTLPTDSLELNAAGSYDTDGNITRYQWTKIEGPEQFSIDSADAEKTIIRDLVFGRYIFLLTITDNKGSTSIDSVEVMVLADPTNIQPVANAGEFAVVTLPSNQYILDAGRSNDPDGFIIKYDWNQLAGPVSLWTGTVSNKMVTIQQLAAGLYRFSLQVVDNNGAIDQDTVELLVNNPPVAFAGSDRVIHFPENSVTADGAASTDADGNIQNFQWEYLSGPTQFSIQHPDSAITVIAQLAVGVYYFTLTVTDNNGGKDVDTIRVVVNEKPYANAGPDIVLTLPSSITVLDGNGSMDKDGTIQNYTWSYISGPASYKLVNPFNPATILSELAQGVYIFSLKVTDQYGAEGVDTVSVTVNKAPNKVPVANAGAGFAVYLPDPYIQLNGSGSYDPDGIIVSYRWKLVSGPGSVSFNDTTSSFAIVKGVQAGSYTFQLTVKDNEGALASTQITVLVNEALNKLPVARAGRDTTIMLPYSRVNLNGSASYDPDGIIFLYNWRKLTGPAGPVLLNSGSAIAKVIDLVEGTYSFELSVKDNLGALSKDTVNVNVVNNMRTAELFQLNPNPATNQIRVLYQMDALSNGKLSVYDQSGYLRMSYPFQSNPGLFQKEIVISSLQPGMYYLEIYINNQKRIIRKFIKQ